MEQVSGETLERADSLGKNWTLGQYNLRYKVGGGVETDFSLSLCKGKCNLKVKMKLSLVSLISKRLSCVMV